MKLLLKLEKLIIDFFVPEDAPKPLIVLPVNRELLAVERAAARFNSRKRKGSYAI